MSAEPERPVLLRTFEVALAEADGRTLDARIVPFNVPTTVVDPPDPRPYQEMFVPGAFRHQIRAADRLRIWLNFEHEQGLRGVIGRALTLEERSDALYGSFRMLDGPDGDKALALVREGLLTGLSMEFADMARTPDPRDRVDGVTRRMRAHIRAVSLCRFPAYRAAQVLAMRAQPDDDEDEPETPVEEVAAPRARVERAAPIDEALAERLERLGLGR